jgi:hypothetical protein
MRQLGAWKLQRQTVSCKDRAQIRQRVDRMHASQRPRFCRVNRVDETVSDSAAQERSLENPWRIEVVHEAACTTNQGPILDTRMTTADITHPRHRKCFLGYCSGSACDRGGKVALRRAVGGVIQDRIVPVHSIGMPLALTMAAQ